MTISPPEPETDSLDKDKEMDAMNASDVRTH